MQKSLIDALIQDLTPVEIATRPPKRLRGILAAVAFGSTPLALFFPIRTDILSQFHLLSFSLSFAMLFALSVISFWMALKMGAPGAVGSPLKKALILLLVFLLAQSLYSGGQPVRPLASAPTSDLRCAGQMLLCALVPYLVCFHLIARLAPTLWGPTLLFALVGSFSLSSLILQLSCGIDIPGHRWMGHLSFPLLAMMILLGPSIYVLRRLQTRRELKGTTLPIVWTHPQ